MLQASAPDGHQVHHLQGALQIADMDRGFYGDHALTLALHPSETEERLMVRLLAFALQVPASDHGGALVRARPVGHRRARPVAARPDRASCCTGSRSASPTSAAWPRPAAARDRVTVYCYGSASPIWWAACRTSWRG
jgi:hypothetical protein